ncbi:hypothetical protein V6Z12_D07G037900 [Gossypium hirsutum]
MMIDGQIMGSSNVSLSANIQICSMPELAEEVHMMSCTFSFALDIMS